MSAASELRRIQKSLKSLPRKWAEESGKTVKKAATKTLNADTGGDASLSHAPGKLKIDTKVQGDSIATLIVSPGKRGMARWTWLEEGTKPHTAGGRYKGARHPGTRPRHTWTRAVDPAVKVLIDDARKRFGVAVKGH